MNRNKKIAICYFLTAAICYVCSVIWFCSDKGGLGSMWLCIGSANLCLGSVWMKKAQESEDQNKQDEKES